MIIGITGSFGSGKTTVSGMFRKHGFHVINVDKIYHDNFYRSHPLRKKIKKEFGTLDRNELKRIVFNDSAKLKKLNEITHPLIIKKMNMEIKKIKKKSKNARIAVDIPLLFESSSERLFDRTVVVKSDRKTQIKRAMQKRKKYSKKEIMQIIKSQMPLKEKIKRADFVVDNSKSQIKTANQVRIISENVLSTV